jgi:sec-independent protein translocase protein TatA
MLNNIGPAGLILIAVVVLVLFGRGKIAGLMGEVGKGITAFKNGVKSPDGEIEDNSTTASADGSAARDVTPEQRAADRDNA